MVKKGVLFLLVIFCLGFLNAQSVTIISPKDNEIVRTQTVTINATITDLNSKYCTYEFTNDGYKHGLISVSGSPYEFVKAVDLEKDDNYTLTITCYGAEEITDNVNFEVKTTPIELVSHSPDGTVYSQNVLINFLFDDIFELHYLNISGEDFTEDAVVDGKSLSLSKVFEDSVGFYAVTAKVRGMAGHFLESTFSFILDARGTIKGSVIDENSDGIKNALITVENLDTDEIESFTSNVDGSYTLDLIEGDYKITTSKPGYFDDIQEAVSINGETDKSENIILTKQIPSNVAIENLVISNNLVEGQILDINAILSNKLDTAISEVSYSLYVDDVLKDTKTTSLSASQDKAINFKWIAEQSEHVVKIQADVSGEATLSNNFAEKEVLITSLEESVDFGDIEIYKFSDFSVVEEVNHGEKFIVSAEVKNLGLSPVYDIATELVIEKLGSASYFDLFNELGIGIKNPKIIDIDSGSSVYVEWVVQIPEETGDVDISVLLEEISSDAKELSIEGVMCIDNDVNSYFPDGGLNYFMEGWTTLNDEVGTTLSDMCIDSEHLGEAYCSGEIYGMKIVNCPCEFSTCTGCGDSDGGKDYYVQGTVVNSPNIEENDYCGNENVLMEFWCDGNVNKLEPYECLFGCNSDAGACYKCQDSDMNETYRDGKNYYESGWVGGGSPSDACKPDGKTLVEFYCDGAHDNYASIEYDCSDEGMICVAGRCQ